MHLPDIDNLWLIMDYDLFPVDPLEEFKRKAIEVLSSKQNAKLEEITIERLNEKGYIFNDKTEFYDFITNKIYRFAHSKYPDHWEIWLNHNNKMEFLFSYFIETETDFEVKDYKMNFVQNIQFRFYQKQ